MRLTRRLKRAIPGQLRISSKAIICRMLCRHAASSGQDIFLHVSRRSGSTWLTEIIAAEPDVRCVQDPLTVRNIPKRFRNLLNTASEDYFSRVTPDHDALMSEYFDGILDGRIHVGTQWNPLSPQFHRNTHRTIVKLCNAGGMAAWLDQKYSGHSLLMVRHPIPTVLSQQQWGMLPYTTVFRDDEWFFDHVLNEQQRQLVHRIIAEGDVQAAGVADWCMENLIPLCHLTDQQRLVITYEELSIHAAEVIGKLADYCHLKCTDRLQLQSSKPSVTQSEEAAKAGISSAHWARWISRLDTATRQKLMEICSVFGIHTYSWDNGLPTEHWIGKAPDSESLIKMPSE